MNSHHGSLQSGGISHLLLGTGATGEQYILLEAEEYCNLHGHKPPGLWHIAVLKFSLRIA